MKSSWPQDLWYIYLHRKILSILFIFRLIKWRKRPGSHVSHLLFTSAPSILRINKTRTSWYRNHHLIICDISRAKYIFLISNIHLNNSVCYSSIVNYVATLVFYNYEHSKKGHLLILLFWLARDSYESLASLKSKIRRCPFFGCS